MIIGSASACIATSMTFRKKPTLRSIQQNFLAFAPEGVEIPEFMKHRNGQKDGQKDTPNPNNTDNTNGYSLNKRPNRTDEKKFVVALLKEATKHVELWLRRNTNGTYRTLDGKAIVRVGLGTGVGDLVGYTVRTITPEMVGQHVAVYTEIEAKLTDGGRLSDEQIARQAVVQTAGGIAIVAWDQDGVDKVIEQLVPNTIPCLV